MDVLWARLAALLVLLLSGTISSAQGSRILLDDSINGYVPASCHACASWGAGLQLCSSDGKFLGSNLCEA
eukprot:scaffold98405_cov30-Prasinocladus_malaysianus.AAC.1